jgi:hypothetical protein
MWEETMLQLGDFAPQTPSIILFEPRCSFFEEHLSRHLNEKSANRPLADQRSRVVRRGGFSGN